MQIDRLLKSKIVIDQVTLPEDPNEQRYRMRITGEHEPQVIIGEKDASISVLRPRPTAGREYPWPSLAAPPDSRLRLDLVGFPVVLPIDDRLYEVTFQLGDPVVTATVWLESQHCGNRPAHQFVECENATAQTADS